MMNVSSTSAGSLGLNHQRQLPSGMPPGRLTEAAKRTDMRLSAELATPPDWNDHYKQALRHSAPYLKVKIDPASREFQVLLDFIGPGACQVTEINRVVNPALWRRFLATRKELICTKSNNIDVLGAFGMEDEELANRAASEPLNPDMPQYEDNVALLFHCTRGKDMDAILSEGLDDRLASSTGAYGKGIYFADDPAKSLTYDGTGGTLFIFAVYLGDCRITPGSGIIREPAKSKSQKRSQMDLFFDSISGGHGGYNEYVIFNRSQCCPLYMVSCKSTGKAGSGPYDYTIRRNPPPFVWVANPADKPDYPWPFLAKVIFEEMYPPNPPRKVEKKLPQPKSIPSERTIQEHLSDLWTMGFTNNEENKAILAQFDYDFPSTVNHLVEIGYDPSAQGAVGGSTLKEGRTEASAIDDDVNIEEEEEKLFNLAVQFSLQYS